MLTSFPILQDAAGGQLVSMLIPFGLIILVFYFLIIRPQNKKQKETQAMLAAVKKNDKVVTAGGIRGVVLQVKDETVILKVDENTKMEFSKSAISNVLEAKNGGKEKASKDKQADKEAKSEKTDDAQ